jgi:hypothetical protein
VRAEDEIFLTKLMLAWGYSVSRPKVSLSPRMYEGLWAIASCRDRTEAFFGQFLPSLFPFADPAPSDRFLLDLSFQKKPPMGND